MPFTNIAKITMKTQFDLTITGHGNGACLEIITEAGNEYAFSAMKECWTPSEILANIPPKLQVGVRSNVSKKFALIPPPSLH